MDIVKNIYLTEYAISCVKISRQIQGLNVSSYSLQTVANPSLLPTNDKGIKSCGFALFKSGRMQHFYDPEMNHELIAH